MKTTNIFLAVAMGLACLGGLSVRAKDTTKATPFTKILQSVPAADLPAKAAQLVKEVKAQEIEATTISVVTVAVGINPEAASQIVAAIAKAMPDMASVAAATAASLQPKQAGAIAKAAAAAAPSQAAKIVLAVCHEAPSQYQSVAAAAAEAAPSASKEIVEAVGQSIPSRKPSIDQALGVYGGSVPSVPIILDQASKSAPPVAMNSGSPRGPVITPPYKPLTTTPVNINSSTSGEVPPGGRDYAAP